MKKERIAYVDLFRACGILLMIMGHVGFGGLFDKWIHGFHIPMFFFASGWFYKKGDSFSEFCRRKGKSILVPYLALGAAELLCLLPFVEEYRNPRILYCWLLENTASVPARCGSLHVSPVPGALWFLTALFFCEIFYRTADRFLGLTWKLHLGIALAALFGMSAGMLLPFRLWWALDTALTGMSFYHLARCLKHGCFRKITDLKLWEALTAGIFFSASILFSPPCNMRTASYGLAPLFWINAAGLTMAGWNLARCLEPYLAAGALTRRLSGWLERVGKNSIVYLCLNQIVILAVNNLTDLSGLTGLAARGVILLLSLVILTVLEKLICGTKLKILIGR